MKRPAIKFDEKDIKFYNFKNTTISLFEARLNDLVKKIRPVRMEQDVVKMFEGLSESSISKSYEFILEIGNYILNNFLFNDPMVPLKKIAMSKSENTLLHRFSSYDDNIHSKLTVGNLQHLQKVLRELKFGWDLSHNVEMYSKPLSAAEFIAISTCCEDPTVTAIELKKQKAELKEIMIDNYQQGAAFFDNPLSTFGLYLYELSPLADEAILNELSPRQYYKILEIIEDGILLKGAKKSSIMNY